MWPYDNYPDVNFLIYKLPLVEVPHLPSCKIKSSQNPTPSPNDFKITSFDHSIEKEINCYCANNDFDVAAPIRTRKNPSIQTSFSTAKFLNCLHNLHKSMTKTREKKRVCTNRRSWELHRERKNLWSSVSSRSVLSDVIFLKTHLICLLKTLVIGWSASKVTQLP